MKIEKLACPSCGAPIAGDFAPNQLIDCDSCGVPLLITQLETDHPIFCPKCRVLNSDEVHFCSHCGKRLKVECILCHTKNKIDAIYCARCGVHIENAKAKRRRLQEKRQQVKLEREQAFKAKEERQKQEKLERLLEALDEPENHEFALYQINQMGVEAVEGLIETLLADHDPDARYGSARALGQICTAPELNPLIKGRAVKALIKALKDREPAVRYWTMHALGLCQSKLAVEPLAALLKDHHPGVREQARISLQKIGGERAAKLVERAQSKGLLGWMKIG
jgi:hypothetical protein